jgi:Bax protein
MKKFFALVFITCFFLSDACFAKAVIKAKQGALMVENATYAETEELFEKYGYTEFGTPRLQIPRIYLKTLPVDWEKIEKSDDKNKMFIKILLPLVMKINEEIAVERSAILSLLKKEQPLNEKEKNFIEEKALKYDVFTPNKSEKRYKLLLNGLKERVDELPAGFLIAYAGVFSDWGNSRLATVANSLFREEVWYSDEGIEPETAGRADFKYAKFDSLEDGLRSFMHKLNTNITYQFIWTAREASNKIGRKVLGEQIIAVMTYEGKLKNITGMLDFNLSYYKLNKTDMLPVLRDVEAK